MIHQTKHNNKDYLVVYTDFTIDISDEVIKIPIVVQINITKVDPKNHYIIYQKANSIFNHPIKLNKHHPPKKPWYKFWQ